MRKKIEKQLPLTPQGKEHPVNTIYNRLFIHLFKFYLLTLHFY